MGRVKDLLDGSCPGCGQICEKVYGQWWPHAPGALSQCWGTTKTAVDLCESGRHNFGYRAHKPECLYCGAVPA